MATTSQLLSMADRSVLYAEAVECMSLYGMLEYELCCELLLLLNMVALHTEGCGVSSAECYVDVCEGQVMH